MQCYVDTMLGIHEAKEKAWDKWLRKNEPEIRAEMERLRLVYIEEETEITEDKLEDLAIQNVYERGEA